jgi:predicted RNA-binding Zn ribbon-like protein
MSQEQRDRDSDARHREHLAKAAAEKATLRDVEQDVDELLTADSNMKDFVSSDVIEPSEIAPWAAKLKVTPKVLRTAIARVGPKADDVRAFLRSHSELTGARNWAGAALWTLGALITWKLLTRRAR